MRVTTSPPRWPGWRCVLEGKLPGLKLAHLLDDTTALEGFLPTLTEFA